MKKIIPLKISIAVILFFCGIFSYSIYVFANREINCSTDFSSCNGLKGYWKMNEQNRNDNFDGSSINSTKWTVYGDESSSISNNQLHISTSSISDRALISNYVLNGNFDIQVDYDDFALPANNWWGATLAVCDNSDCTDRVRMIRNRGGGFDSYSFDKFVNGSWQGSNNGGGADYSGKLRIVRTSDDFTGYRWQTGSWVSMGNWDNFFSGDAKVLIYITHLEGTGSGSVDFDNFQINQGGGITDSSGNNYSGNITGATFTSSGKINSAINFNGSTNYIEIPNFTGNLANSSAYTSSAWVFSSNFNQPWMKFFGSSYWTGSETDGTILSGINDSQSPFCWVRTNVNGYSVQGSALTNGSWNHIACVYNGSNISIYQNGSFVASTSTSGSGIKNLNWKLNVGSELFGANSGAANLFSGTIDELSIWNRALSASDIRKISNLGNYPTASSFTTAAGSTDFETVSNMASVASMKLANSSGSIQWTNNVNAANQDYDSNVRIGSGYVSINKASLDSSVNTAARVSVSVPNCGNATIYYATGFRSSFADIKANGQVCNGSSNPTCTNISCSGGALSFDVQHFDSYGGEEGNVTPDDQGVPTSLDIDNVPPSFTAGPSDGSSSGAAPTNAGSNVTFTTIAHDNNADQYYLAICKSDDVSAGNDTIPSCPGGDWAISVATNSDSQASVTYTTSSGNTESNDWYAFVCDKNSAGLCSSSSQGTGDAGSPFNVNHKPVIGIKTVTDTSNGTIQPGDTVKFSVVVTDPDIAPAGDTIKMTVCSGDASMGGDTSAFVPGETPACTGGAVLCSSDFVASGATATCNDTTSLVSIPTAHATYNVKIYLQDNHYFTDDGSSNAKTYDVTDTDPVLVSYGATDAPHPSAGGSDGVAFSVSMTDDNGDMDVSEVEGVFFDDTAVNNDCTANENSCYIAATCTLTGQGGAGTGKNAMGSDNALGADCSVTVWFNADASDNWEVQAKPTDSAVKKTGFADSNVNLTNAALQGIDVVQSGISYGTVVIGGTSAGQETSMGNVGNQILDVYVNGTAMASGGNSIPAGQQKWQHQSATFDWDAAASGAGPYGLVATPSGTGDATGCLNRDIAVRTVHATPDTNESVFWKLRIPGGQQAGSYTGQNTFATTDSGTCGTGAEY